MTDSTTASRPATSSTGHDTRPPSVEQMRELTAGLDPEEVRVLLHHGTERPFCGTLLDNKKTGTYVCRVCGLPLFSSKQKFDSGTGWPSFFAPFAPEHVTSLRDSSHGMIRVENRRSAEHTSELQSLMRTSYAVFCLKKKTTHNYTQHT